MRLKESLNHLKAFEYSQKKLNSEKMEIIFESFFYLCRLRELDQKSVSIRLPDIDNEEGGILFCYLWPFESDDDENDYDLLPEMIEIKNHIVHSQRQAAKFCEVSERTLQRWTKKFGLQSFKLGKQRIFIEADLLAFMAERAVGGLIKPRQNIKNLIGE